MKAKYIIIILIFLLKTNILAQCILQDSLPNPDIKLVLNNSSMLQNIQIKEEPAPDAILLNEYRVRTNMITTKKYIKETLNSIDSNIDYNTVSKILIKRYYNKILCGNDTILTDMTLREEKEIFRNLPKPKWKKCYNVHGENNINYYIEIY